MRIVSVTRIGLPEKSNGTETHFFRIVRARGRLWWRRLEWTTVRWDGEYAWWGTTNVVCCSEIAKAIGDFYEKEQIKKRYGVGLWQEISAPDHKVLVNTRAPLFLACTSKESS
jgi:hypothetical protein